MPILELVPDEPTTPFLLDATKKPTLEQLTREEHEALMDAIASQIAQDPASMTRLVQKYMAVATRRDFNTINVQPQAGFVCKTRVVTSKNKKYPVNTAVYINICHAASIPAPPLSTEKEIQKALNAEPDAYYKVPLNMGKERVDGGALIMDACIHTQPYLRSERDLDFRLYILELSMEYVEEIAHVKLSREFTMPSIASKGAIPARLLRVPKPSLLTAVKSELSINHVEWKLEPKIKADKENEMVNVIIRMPDKNSSSWTIDITTNKIILNIQGKSMDILLPNEIDIHHPRCKVDFYKESKDLVLQLKSLERRQYL